MKMQMALVTRSQRFVFWMLANMLIQVTTTVP